MSYRLRRSGGVPGVGDRWWHNFARAARLFINDEREGRPVRVRMGPWEGQTTTDEEGYFQVPIPASASQVPGWHPIDASTPKGSGTGQLLLLPPENRRGLISDLDDTLVVTEVTDKGRMLANTFLKNPTQRTAVAGMASLYRQLLAANPRPEAEPVIYLSASPRQLHEPIAQFLESNGFPKGVLITKRVTDDRTSEPLLDQVAYKTAKIEDILARWPQVRFLLVGDDGESDPEIYDRIRQRHPERIEAIWIRRVHPDPRRARLPGQRDLGEVPAGEHR